MTAFARVQKQFEDGHFCWEIKSVNHRYLDVSFRLPEVFRSIEPQLRSMVKNGVGRGKLECQLKFASNTENYPSLEINEGIVHAVIEAGDTLSKQHFLANDLSVSQLLTWPGVAVMNQPETDSLYQAAGSLFKSALEQLIDMRKTEGRALKEHVLERTQQLRHEIKNAKLITGKSQESAKEKLQRRLNKIKEDVAQERIEQEIALLLTRMDVSEELDRLHTHTEEVCATLEKDEAVGRRLDFLMQELNREANTLSSKSDDIDLTKTAVEMKVNIEQMREQIQNIE